MSNSVILAGARTPIGRLGGSLSSFSGTDLGGFAIAGALERSGLDPSDVDYVIMGHVLLAGEGQATGRQAAAKAGIPLSTPSAVVSKVCLSGMNAIYLADQMIRNGDAEVVVAGGMESMSNAPYLLPGARSGYRFGDSSVVDSMMLDGLFCAFDSCAMGEGTEKYAASAGLERAPQDGFAAESHRRAARASSDGVLAQEIVPVMVTPRRGGPILVEHDEGIRPETTQDSLAQLRAAFAASGNITAGNASQISDGASALVLVSSERAQQLSTKPLGEFVSYGQVAGPDPSLLTQPSRAIRTALSRSELDLGDLSLFEINEAFAAVSLASMDDLGLSGDIVNVNGGAIALGHPLGASGNRITLTLLHELGRRGGGYGAAALCGGGGQGDAIVVRAY